MTEQWVPFPVDTLDEGLNLSRNPILLGNGEASDLLNMDLDRNSAGFSGGAVKFNNQVAPKPGIHFRPDPALTPLTYQAGRSVPLRSYGMIPYSEDTDIGGDFVSDGGALGAETFHLRRGKSFSFEVSVRIPEDTLLYNSEHFGAGAPATGADDDLLAESFGYHEALDDCIVILQKGGDRTSPMSWFIGLVNVGCQARDTTDQLYEIQTGYPIGSERQSDYCLVFGWLDQAGWENSDNEDFRYDLNDPSAAATGEYSTQSLRAVTIPHFVEPGREYHIGVKLGVDTAAMTDSAWNDDGFLQVAVSEGLGVPEVYGYSRKNKIAGYTSDFERGVAAGAWTRTLADTDVNRKEVVGPHGERWITELTTKTGAAAGSSLTSAGTISGAWGASVAGDRWLLDWFVSEESGERVAIEIRNDTDAVTYRVYYRFVGGELQIESFDAGIELPYVEQVPHTDWWRMSAIRELEASDNGDNWTVSIYQGFGTTASVPDVTVPMPDEASYITKASFRELSATETPAPAAHQGNDGIHVYKGPLDSLEYLSKFGIRYSGRDAVFVGLGYRVSAWTDWGFIPYGMDSAPLEHGGFAMVDRSSETFGSLYTGYTLQATRTTTSDDFVTVNRAKLVVGRGSGEIAALNGEAAPSMWTGYGDNTSGFNGEALRGYRFVFPAGAAASLRGGILTIDTLTDQNPSPDEVSFLHNSTFPKGGTFTGEEVLIQAFRWNQRPLTLSEIRFYDLPAEVVPPTTVNAVPDASGSTTRAYVPTGVSGVATQALAVFYPPPSIPKPPGGYPVFVYVEGTGGLEASPITSFTETTRDHLWDAIKAGWVVVSVGVTGTDTSGATATVGCFAPYGSARWNDSAEFFPEKDILWARQWLADNAESLSLNDERVVIAGEDSSGEAAFYSCCGADRGAGVAGFFGKELKTWYPAFATSLSGARFTDADDITVPASTLADADAAHLRAASPSLVARETGALAASIPVFLSYDVAATPTDYTRAASGSPTLANSIASFTGDYWFGIILYQDILGLDASFHGLHSRLAALASIINPTGAPTGIHTNTFETSTADFTHDAHLIQWTLAEFPQAASIVVRDYHDARTQFSLRSEALLDDELDPDLGYLRARYPLDDGGGGVLRETLRGLDGYICPFSAGTSEGGSRGGKELFLSGEGEALFIDLAENPVFLREFEQMQRNGHGGIAVELTFTMPHAYYGIEQSSASAPNIYQGGLAPHIMTWDVREAEDVGLAETPQPILTLTHRVRSSSNSNFIKRPLGFQIELPSRSDNELSGRTPVVQVWDGTNLAWDESAAWVGRRVTLQVGLQSTGTKDQYQAYIAGTPARFFVNTGTRGVTGEDLGDNEFTYYTDGLTLRKRDILRSVITIGGCWNPTDLAVGYTEANCRIILDEVRVFATSAPGELAPDTWGASGTGELPGPNAGVVTSGNGKILGTKSLPNRELLVGEIFQPLGDGVETANLTEGSVTVNPAGRNQFYEAEAEATVRSVKDTYLVVAGDPFEVRETETIGEEVQEFYYVKDVPAGGGSLTLSTPFNDGTRMNAAARSMRMIAYTTFGDDIRDQPLPLGRGNAYDPATTTVDDATITDEYFQNGVPIGVNFRLRVYSPVGNSSPSAFLARWVRGVQSPRRNEILGLHHINERVLAGASGSLFEGDDRWREDGPTEDLERSLEFRGRMLAMTPHLVPYQGDRCVFPSAVNAVLTATEFNAGTIVLDAWVYRIETGRYQTIMWIGSEDTDPQHADGDHKVLLWMRLRDGFPQLCLHSTSTYDGTNIPAEGLFCAEGSQRVPRGEWTHLRWYLFSNTSGTIIETPHLKINGKSSTSSVNVAENGLSGTDWLSTSTLVPAGTEGRVVLGASRSSVTVDLDDPDFEQDEFKGLLLKPRRFQGWLHSLGGRLAQVAMARTNKVSSPPADFNPHTIDYGSAFFDSVQFLADCQEGIGHKLHDQAGSGQYGVIHSHPFISLFHEMGHDDTRFTFATFGNETFVANGGKVVVEEEGSARFAGAPTPRGELSFEITRHPLWEGNVAAFDPEDFQDTGYAVSGDNDPVAAASVDDELQLYHYSTHGNNYLLQEADPTEMKWEKQTELNPSGTAKRSFIFVKGYFRPRNIAGRQVLWSQAEEQSSGRSIEVRDGRVGFFWWDNELKKRVGVETNVPVCRDGYVYYISVRKEFPHKHSSGGNYLMSWFANGNTRRMVVDNVVNGPFAVGDTISDVATGLKTGYVTRVHTDVETGVGSGVVNVLEYINNGTGEFVNNENIDDGGVKTGDVDGTPGQISRDNLVVREFRKAASSNAWETDTFYDAKTDETPNSGGTMSGVKNCIGFATDTDVGPAGTTASGLITPPGLTYSGAISGVVTATENVFHEDMKGMIWQWGATGPNAGISYRIKDVDSTTQITCVADDGFSSTDFSSAAGDEGGVFSGVVLVRSDDLDNSSAADDVPYDTFWMGSPFQADPLSGITPMSAETWCFGWGTASPVNGYDFFEAAATDHIETGFDDFAGEVYSTSTTPGPLFYDGTGGEVFTAVDPEKSPASGYVTTQPNEDLRVAVDPDESSTSAKPLEWQFIESQGLLEGVTRVWVTYYDAENNIEGNPGEALVVRPSGEDTANRSGTAILVLKDLPVRPGFSRRIYMSLIDGFDGFRVAEIADDTASSYAISKTQLQISLGVPLRFDRTEPPRCKIVAVSQAQMFYGALEEQPDGAIYSNPYQPHAVPRSHVLADGTILPGIFVLDTGGNSEVTGMRDLLGRLIIFKRNGAWGISASGGVVSQQIISTGVGCVSQESIAYLDNTLYWCDVRGPVSFGGTGVPLYLGVKLEPYFEEVMEDDYFGRISAAINRNRNQYVFTARRVDDDYPQERISLEFDHELSGVFSRLKRSAVHRITRYRDPNLTALSEVDDRAGGSRRFIGGSDDGFLYWLDRSDTISAGMGPNDSVHGAKSITGSVTTWTTPTAIAASGSIDTSLEGPRGARVRWREAETDREAVVLFSGGAALYPERPASNLPSAGDTLTVGALLHLWKSKHYSFDHPSLYKKLYFLDVLRSVEASGLLYVDLFLDQSSTAHAFDEPLMLDLTDETEEIDVSQAQGFKRVQIQLRTRADQVETSCELFSLVWRFAPTEPR